MAAQPAQLDLGDPRIVSTYNEIRGADGTADWMILAVAPRLPGSAKDVLTVMGTGIGGLDEFQTQISQAPLTGYGYLKHDNKFLFVEIVPEQLSGADRIIARKYGKQIQTVLKDYDSSLTITSGVNPSTSGSDIQAAALSIDAAGARKRAPSVTSENSAFKAGVSSTSLTSELAMDSWAEEHAKRLRDNAAGRERYKEEAERKLKALSDQRAKEAQWLAEKEAKEQAMKDSFKAEFQAYEDSTRKDHVLGKWLDQASAGGRFWQRRYVEIQGPSIRLFKEGSSNQDAIVTIDLRSASVRSARDTCYLPHTFVVCDASGREHTLHALDSKDYLQSVAAVERTCGSSSGSAGRNAVRA
ncbi:hypothetical protein HDU88_006999 [Geranomyces variabilis]|nr:hypothetical protein HDU88_006999 [Geranomyces variabilis]